MKKILYILFLLVGSCIPALASGIAYNAADITPDTRITAATAIITSSSVSSGFYQIGGSTVIAHSTELSPLLIGRKAGPLTTGNGNTFVGYNAGENITDGHSNTLIGNGAASGFVNGSHNVVIGLIAGTKAAPSTIVNLSSSVVIGSGARLGTSDGGGVNNVVIGYNAAAGSFSMSNGIIIGANVIGASNRLNIGNLVTGTIGGSSVTIKENLYTSTITAYNMVVATITYPDGSNASSAHKMLVSSVVYNGAADYYTTTQTSPLACVPGSTLTFRAESGVTYRVGVQGSIQKTGTDTEAHMTFRLDGQFVPPLTADIHPAAVEAGVGNHGNMSWFFYITATEGVHDICYSLFVVSGTVAIPQNHTMTFFVEEI